VSKGKLDTFKPQRRNANRHTQRGLGALETSIQKDGWIGAITVAADGETFDGSARIEVGAATGFDDVIVVESDGTKPIVHRRIDIPTADDPRAVRLGYAANRVAALNLDFDPAVILADLDAGLDLSALWNEGEIEALAAALIGEAAKVDDPGAQVDKADALQAEWQVKAGDVWQAGEHYIICGDCREFGTWQKLLSAAKVERVNGVFTSPPYAEQRKDQYGGVPVDEYVAWWEDVQANVRAHLANDGSFFVNIKAHCEDGERSLYVMDLVSAMRRRWSWLFVEELCWTHQGVAGYWPNRFKNGFEPVYQFCCKSMIKFYPNSVRHVAAQSTMNRIALAKRTGETKEGRKNSRTGSNFGIDYGNMADFDGSALPSNVIAVSTETSNVGHAAAFPVALPDFFIRAYSDTGDAWLDPFLGSGTTIVAAHQNQRRGLGIERLEKYVAVTLQRLADMGLSPRLVG
jgi:site-specific DNA-methyltransferase (adenine-specific)